MAKDWPKNRTPRRRAPGPSAVRPGEAVPAYKLSHLRGPPALAGPSVTSCQACSDSRRSWAGPYSTRPGAAQQNSCPRAAPGGPGGQAGRRGMHRCPRCVYPVTVGPGWGRLRLAGRLDHSRRGRCPGKRAVIGEDEIPRLHIAVNDPGGVRGGEPRRLLRIAQRELNRVRSAAGEQPGQARAAQQFHHHEGVPPSIPASWITTTFGCRSPASVRARGRTGAPAPAGPVLTCTA